MNELQQQLDGLAPQQKAVALHDGHCLAIAAPGSGKTKTLAVKAALNLSRGRTVAAVTFTRDAALELRERIILIAGKQALPSLLVGTFHSIALSMAFPGKQRTPMGSNILRKGFSRLQRPWEIVREGSRRGFVARALKHAELEMTIDEATAVVEGIKSGQKEPDSHRHAELARMYQEILRRHGVIDLQDIVLHTNRAIAEGVISPLPCDCLLIDEYQDTDLAQYEWSMLHRQASTLTAVGDDDQSIYGFRRALGYKGMTDFARQLNAQAIVLGMNYRCHAEVLAPAARLIACNMQRMAKALLAHKGAGGVALWERYASRQREAQVCCERARKSLAAGRSMGVLARTNKRLDDMEVQCLKHRVPYTRSEGGSVLKSHEMAVFLAALSALLGMDARDGDVLLAWCGVGEDELKALHAAHGADLLQPKSKAALAGVDLSPNARKAYAQVQRRFEEWGQLLAAGAVAYVLDKLLGLLIEHTDDKRSVAALEIVCEVFSKPVGGAGDDGVVDGTVQMRARVQRTKDMSAQPDKDKKPEGNPVVLLTAHGAKGLEWDEVWLLGAEEGRFPDEASSIQEERRLFYVAMTRARTTLIISAAGKAAISPFVHEAGVERIGEGADVVALP
ncbi:ATP-dependent helicase [Verminephrobacter eiseniae]|nr:ATP-dependent helicase [Verminephrobacter eiseniae]MCW5284919.1 ATP-dependent helicase [Verminephrobacter eiseniae]MCW5302627.1 ATP-dependent helicase [Verminephrobacter eiseniae]MCW8182529.1 ATP-dependent helicase [Verminephrobacter eiseniae]MCW8192274.1 ATP-dependent helicase [Verminephrobacter eiseniae]